MSKNEGAEPKVDWLPIRLAVFKFGMADDDQVSGLQEKPLDELSDSEINNLGPMLYSRSQLTRLLEAKSGANTATIDTTFGKFSFQLADGSTIAGTPWAILRVSKKTDTDIDPRIYAESLFNREGLVRVNDEEVVKNTKQFDAVRRATGLVWRQSMLGMFDRSVSIGSLVLYARPGSITADFERLPSDVWPLLEVTDWEDGVAAAPDRAVYWSIHVGPSNPDGTVPVKPATAVQQVRNRAKIAIADIYPDGVPDPAIEPNKILYRKIEKWLTDRNMRRPSDTTILRAAGRR